MKGNEVDWQIHIHPSATSTTHRLGCEPIGVRYGAAVQCKRFSCTDAFTCCFLTNVPRHVITTKNDLAWVLKQLHELAR